MHSLTDNSRYPTGYDPNNPTPRRSFATATRLSDQRQALRELREANPHLREIIVDPDSDQWPTAAREPWHLYQWMIRAASIAEDVLVDMPAADRILVLRKENPWALERILIRSRDDHEAQMRAEGDADPCSPINDLIAQVRRITREIQA
jgi:hypothetical protein